MKKQTIIKQYRLKCYHCGYNKGNVITWNSDEEKYENPYLSQWRRMVRWSFLPGYVLLRPEIFEPIIPDKI